ncbi:hypothetical protein LCGC14_0495060 [marine sediment metagenome]|uniref:Uncharacterized protein n=1 Tax=marine sediment metagenome TaxID=412755 RepID=A0A0F9SAJ9_9ZZZZ
MTDNKKSNAINQIIADIFFDDEGKKTFFQLSVGDFIIKFCNQYNITVDDSIKWTKEMEKSMSNSFLIKN